MKKSIKVNEIRDYVTLNPREKEYVELTFNKAAGIWRSNGYSAEINVPPHTADDKFVMSIESDAVSDVKYKIARIADSLDIDTNGALGYHLHIKLESGVSGTSVKGKITIRIFANSKDITRNMELYNAAIVSYDDGHIEHV